MIRATLLALSLTLAGPLLAEDGPNLAAPIPAAPAAPGAVQITALAWQLFAVGLEREDPLMLLTAIALAHQSGMRAATGWTLTSPETEVALPALPSGLPRDPASDAAMALAVLMAEGDPDLADLAADIEAGLTLRKPASRISMASAALAGGTEARWRIAFFGQSRAELALIADGQGTSGLGLQITDESGHRICLHARPDRVAYCAFTPARNGYFTVTVTNPGPTALTYRLLSN